MTRFTTPFKTLRELTFNAFLGLTISNSGCLVSAFSCEVDNDMDGDEYLLSPRTNSRKISVLVRWEF